MVQIIGGKWKRKQLKVLKTRSLRPTPVRVRETVFNWLSTRIDLTEAKVLDLFCGTGALGLEAASRGADEVHLIDSNRHVIRELIFFLKGLHTVTNINAECVDAIKWLNFNLSKKFDLIFLDPPFNSTLLKKTLPIISDQISHKAIIYVEYDDEIEFFFNSLGFQILCSSKNGLVRYCLIKKKSLRTST